LIVAGDSDIPIDLLPPMIVLDDPANPFFAHLFDPQDFGRSLGSGARFLGAQIAVTNEPVCTENLIRVDDVTESPKLAE
jgi:hypothetical protein